MPHDVFGEDSNFQVVGNLYGTHAARPSAGGVLDGIFYVETDTGDVVQAQGGSWVTVDTLTTADVSSVFGRSGAVTAQTGDYNASQVDKTYAGNPNGNVTADFIGDLCIDTTNGKLYQATAADNSHWNIMNGQGFTIAAGAAVGVLFTNNDTDDPPLYLSNSNATGPQLRVGGINFFTNAGNPNTVITAEAIGDLCVDKTNGALYVAQVADNAHWVAL